ncbi:MAG TPA: hypothetical protein VGK27_07660 [Candidatus Deferrimicrobiaceae bacterium]|jgi:hypothetical protein
MPRLLIDGNEAQWELSGLPDLSALMLRLYQDSADSGRVVCRVEVDGRELDAAGEKELADTPLAGFTEVSVTTGTAAELYKSGIAGALSLAEAMRTDIGRASASFRQGDFEGGMSMYMACVSSMETFFQLCGAILGGFQAGCFIMGEGTAPPEPPSTDTAEILNRLLEAQRGEDWTLMADVLEYEVVPNLDGWSRFLGELQGAQTK